MHLSSKGRSWQFVIAVLIVVSLACGSSTATQTQPAPNGEQVQTEPANISQQENNADQINTPNPTSTPKPTNTPKPTDTPTPLPIGLSRSIPFSRAEIVSAPNWDVQVLETKRGDDAWKDIQAANMYNEAAPEGMEYLLVKLHVKSTYADSDEHSIGGCDFDVTGDRLVRYTCSMASVVEPDPQLDATLFTGGEAEGWAAYLVAQGEGNLILIVNEIFNFDTDAVRYIALDDGASLSVSPELSTIKPTNLGEDRNNPARLIDKVITEDWEISVLEAFRGDDAWKMVQEANQFNEPPAEGLEYIVVKIHARYIGTEDSTQSIDGNSFNSTGSAGVLYDSPSVVDPKPSLDYSLFPGGEAEGWVTIQAAVGETGVSLIFEPIFDFSDKNKRFISLEP